MSRFFLPPAECREPELTLTGREAHHALHVLRLKAGEPVTVLNGAGDEFRCEAISFSRDAVRLRVLAKQSLTRPLHRITLIQAIPRGKAFETIVQKATELGASRIVPLLTERVVAQVSDEQAEAKVEKWQAVAVESIKQCGSPWLPAIDPPLSLIEFLQRREMFELQLIGALSGAPRHPREHLDPFKAKQGRMPRTIGLWVGPEGDFTESELAAVCAAGALPVTLGRHVLRSDTAAIYCLSVLNYEFDAPGITSGAIE